jgi:hypothetical protein
MLLRDYRIEVRSLKKADVSVLSVESRSNLTSTKFLTQGVLGVNRPQLVFDPFCFYKMFRNFGAIPPLLPTSL